MAFIFTVETGTGADAAANSYVSVVEADDIITTNIHASVAWDALTTDQKERLLVWASRYVDDHTVWKGSKTVESSPLRWPRTGVCDRDDVLIDATTIPTQLKIAIAEMARYLVAEDRTVERDTDGLERVKADVVEIEFLAGYRLPSIPTNMQYLVAGLGVIFGGTARYGKVRR
jgi:hypothetical protein